MDEFEKAEMQFDNEVGEYAAKLIKNGLARPYNAISMATESIMIDRRMKNNKPLNSERKKSGLFHENLKAKRSNNG